MLRLDDTDRERSTEAYAQQIREDLRWLGFTWDSEAKQSDRTERYLAAAEQLKAAGRLYACYETPDELERRRKRQLASGRPPIYDRAALKLTAEERARLEAEARATLALPARQFGGAGVSYRSIRTSRGTISSVASRPWIWDRCRILCSSGRTGRFSTRLQVWWTTSTLGSRISSAVRITSRTRCAGRSIPRTVCHTPVVRTSRAADGRR